MLWSQSFFESRLFFPLSLFIFLRSFDYSKIPFCQLNFTHPLHWDPSLINPLSSLIPNKKALQSITANQWKCSLHKWKSSTSFYWKTGRSNSTFKLDEDNFLMRKFKKLHVDRIILPDCEFSVAASLFPFQHIGVGETEELLSLTWQDTDTHDPCSSLSLFYPTWSTSNNLNFFIFLLRALLLGSYLNTRRGPKADTLNTVEITFKSSKHH